MSRSPKSSRVSGSSALAADTAFQTWVRLSAGTGYRNTPLWRYVGQRSLDRKLTRLADLYRRSAPERRRLIRTYFTSRTRELDEMWLYVRRVARLIRSRRDVVWLRRGLAIAAIEGGRMDYRDTIVSLVILRYAAERASIQTRSNFNEAKGMADRNACGIFTNARDHSRSDVVYTVREFGPPDWVAELGGPVDDDEDSL